VFHRRPRRSFPRRRESRRPAALSSAKSRRVRLGSPDVPGKVNGMRELAGGALGMNARGSNPGSHGPGSPKKGPARQAAPVLYPSITLRQRSGTPDQAR
jgi:hypothetical protein